MAFIGKTLITIGIIMALIGIALLSADKIPWIGKLPGDIFIQRKNFSFYFPITSCLIVSVVLSLVLYFLMRR